MCSVRRIASRKQGKRTADDDTAAAAAFPAAPDRAPVECGNRGRVLSPRRSTCRSEYAAPTKSAKRFPSPIPPDFRSEPLPFPAVLRYNLSWTEFFLLRLWIVAFSFYLIGFTLSIFFADTPTFIIEPIFGAGVHQFLFGGSNDKADGTGGGGHSGRVCGRYEAYGDKQIECRQRAAMRKGRCLL